MSVAQEGGRAHCRVMGRPHAMAGFLCPELRKGKSNNAVSLGLLFASLIPSVFLIFIVVSLTSLLLLFLLVCLSVFLS